MISATPGNMLLDAEQWGLDNHRLVVAEGTDTPGYVGFNMLLSEKRVLKASMSKEEDIRGMMKTIRERWSTPRYHILRVSKKLRSTSKLNEIIMSHGYMMSDHDSTNRCEDIDTLLKTPPVRHHFLCIKGFWKAAKTLNDKYIGVCYEVTTDCTAAAQGLGGRLLGFGKQRGPEAPLLYCNPTLIEEYNNWLVKGCDYMRCKRFHSAALKIRNGEIQYIKPSLVLAESSAHLEPVPRRGPNMDVTQQEETLHTTGVKRIASNVGYPQTQCLWLTEAPLTLTPAQFKTRYNLDSIPSTARELSRIITNSHVSYTGPSAIAVARLDNYYQKPEWAGKGLHIFKKKHKDVGDTFIVIQRNVQLLEQLRTAPPGQVYYAYNEKLQIDKYITEV